MFGGDTLHVKNNPSLVSIDTNCSMNNTLPTYSYSNLIDITVPSTQRLQLGSAMQYDASILGISGVYGNRNIQSLKLSGEYANCQFLGHLTKLTMSGDVLFNRCIFSSVMYNTSSSNLLTLKDCSSSNATAMPLATFSCGTAEVV